MQTKLEAYLSFKDTARPAMEFYHSVFGGTLTMSTFKEYGLSDDPNEGNKIMHATLVGDNGFTFNAADTPSEIPFSVGTNFSLALSGNNEAELRKYWDKLAEGGKVTLPLERAPWGDTFGMITDKFGVSWMVDIADQKETIEA